MTLGDALFVGAFIILPLAIVIWCLTTLRSLRRRRKRAAEAAAYLPNLTEGTAEMPIVAAAGDAALESAGATEQFAPPRRDWAATVRPTRAQPGPTSTTTLAPIIVQARPFHPPAFRGRSAGVVSRMTPPAARWPAAHRRVGKDMTRKDVMRKDIKT